MKVAKKPRLVVEEPKPQKKPRGSVPLEDTKETPVYVSDRHRGYGELANYPTEVCLNPLRFLAFDCPGCQFYKPCKCYSKDNYKKRKTKAYEDDEPLVVKDEPTAEKAVEKPKKKSKKPKASEDKPKLTRKERREARKKRKEAQK